MFSAFYHFELKRELQAQLTQNKLSIAVQLSVLNELMRYLIAHYVGKMPLPHVGELKI